LNPLSREPHRCTEVRASLRNTGASDVAYARGKRRVHSLKMWCVEAHDHDRFPELAVRDAAQRRDVVWLTAALADPKMRGSAALALGNLQAREAVPALIRNLRVKNDLDRSAAVIALRKIEDASAAPALLEIALRDESWNLRTSAIDALATLDDPRGVQLLARLAVDPKSVFVGATRSYDAMPRPLGRRPSIRWTRRWSLRRLRELKAVNALEVLEPASTWRPSPHAIRLQRTIYELRRAASASR
jgi:hypothetical protein